MRSTPAFAPAALDPRVPALLAGYPSSLFSDTLHASIELMHRYTLTLAVDVLERLGAVESLGTEQSADALHRRLSLVPEFLPTLQWLLDAAAELAYLETSEGVSGRTYRRSQNAPEYDLASLRASGLAYDPGNSGTLDLLDHAAALYPLVARGKTSADRALFEPDAIALWLAYFNGRNPTYAVNNEIAAVSAVDRLAKLQRFRMLEVGAGAGSATEVVLRLLSERGLLARLERYVVSEPSPFFLRRAQRELGRRYRDLPLVFTSLDVNDDWTAQLESHNAFDLVFGVNVMHVAYDLAGALARARSVLAPHGWLVIGECLRTSRQRPIFPELIFQILQSFTNVRIDPDLRPRAGFLEPAHWRPALAAAGFEDVGIEPDVEAIATLCPNFLAGAVCGRRGTCLNLPPLLIG
jgi:SAM-dependent methyltransferase